VEERTAGEFKIRRAFVGSLGGLLVLLLTLTLVCVIQGEPPIKAGLVGMIAMVVAALLAVSMSRKLEVGPDRVVLHRFGRRKILYFAEITAMESLTIRKRVFVTLCAGDEFIILSNAYERFGELVEVLLARVPAQSVSDDARAMAAAPPVRRNDIVSCWLGIVLLLVILWHQLYGGG
jgi:hypothetical protein